METLVLAQTPSRTAVQIQSANLLSEILALHLAHPELHPNFANQERNYWLHPKVSSADRIQPGHQTGSEPG